MKPPTHSSSEKPDSNGFTKVNNRKKNHKKPPSNPKNPSSNASIPSTSNNFDILAQLEPKASESFSEVLPKAISKPNPLGPGQSQKPLQPTDLTTSTPSVKPIWKPHGMDIDILQQEINVATEFAMESSEVKHTEEEPESIDIGDLDIMGLQQASRKK